MRKIWKDNPPEWLENWKEDFKSKKGRMPSFNDISEKNKIRLRDTLIDEQGYICCYCMRRILKHSTADKGNEETVIVEHFKPRYQKLEDEWDYYNLFASCSGQEDEMALSRIHCDRRKENWFDERLPSPCSEEFERLVHYGISGMVTPYHKSNHPMHSLELLLIEKLGLNAPFLVRNRKKSINASEIMDEDLSYGSKDWEDLIRYYDNKHEGKYEEYCMAFIDIIRRYFITE